MNTKMTDLEESDQSQLKRMQDQVGLGEVPTRIIQRRIENFQLILSSFSSFFSGQQETQITNVADHLGFDKTLVFMTKPNKAVAISSLNGELLWSRLIKDPVRRMVLEQASGTAATLEVITSTGSLIKIDPVTGKVRATKSIVADLPQSVE